jgi:hypothetical protein
LYLGRSRFDCQEAVLVRIGAVIHAPRPVALLPAHANEAEAQSEEKRDEGKRTSRHYWKVRGAEGLSKRASNNTWGVSDLERKTTRAEQTASEFKAGHSGMAMDQNPRVGHPARPQPSQNMHPKMEIFLYLYSLKKLFIFYSYSLKKLFIFYSYLLKILDNE